MAATAVGQNVDETVRADMSVNLQERIRLSGGEARALSESALLGMGFEAEESQIIADHVIDAALCGYEYSGLAKLLNIADSPRFKLPRRPIRIIRDTGVSVLFDGGNNIGMFAMYHAALTAIERAQRHGLALIGLTNSWTSGRCAYYVERIARAGLIGIHTVSASRSVSPFGGRNPRSARTLSHSAFPHWLTRL